MSDSPADPACRQRTWLNLDRNCLSRRDLPWVAGPGRSNAGRLEVRSDPATPAAQESGGGAQHAATLPPQEFLLQEPTRQEATRPEPTRPELGAQEPARHEPVPQASPTQASILHDAAPKAALPQEAPPDNSASQLFTPQELTPRELAPQETAPQQPTAQRPVQHSNVAAPGRATPAQRPVAREPRVTKPAAGAQTRLPASKTAARGERTAKRPANEALSTVRKFGEQLPEIPANSMPRMARVAKSSSARRRSRMCTTTLRHGSAPQPLAAFPRHAEAVTRTAEVPTATRCPGAGFHHRG